MPYILNLRNIESDDLELTGREAIINAKLFEDSIKTTDGFVFTSRAFDDFLTAANLIEPISESLSRVKPFSKILAKRASEEISELILNSPLPNIIGRPLSEAYRNLGDHGNPYVFIQPSNIIAPEFLSSDIENFKEINVRGEKELIYKIKEMWLSLFTPEAIEWRVNKNYGGILSMGVLIKRMVQSEVSGIAYSFSPLEQSNHIIEIQALYGFSDPKDESDSQADIYKVDKKTLNIIEKNIIQQDQMIVRKGNYAPGETPNIKIEISQHWKKSQKLSDKKIEDLATKVLGLERLYNRPVEVMWGLELGEFTILNIEEFTPVKKQTKKRESPLETQPLKTSEINLDNIYSPKIEVIPHNTVEKIEKKAEEKVEQLVEEVQKLVKNVTDEIPVMPDYETEEKLQEKFEDIEKQVEEASQEIVEYKFLTPLFLEVSRMNSEVLTNARQFNGAYLDGTEIILNNNALPEHIIESESKLNQAMNIFTMDISTSARILDDNPLIYQFSNIDSEKLKLLGLEDNHLKYFNDERFIENPESLTVEILALKKSRNQMNYKNINLSIPSLKSYENLVKIKKLISSQGLRRSSSLKMYAEVALPSFIFELRRIEDGDIDGIIIDYEKLYSNSTGKHIIHDNDHQVILNQIEVIKDITSGKDLEFWIKIRNSEYRKDVIERIVGLGVNGIILRDLPENNFAKLFKEAEERNAQNLKPRKKRRGRTIKDLL